MGSWEDNTSAKPSKATSSAQEAPTTPSYPDWSNSMQAYYGAAATPSFFTTTAASPTPHPYMWGGQHAMMPPYRTPLPYPAFYPPGGLYAHTTMATVANMGQGNGEMEGKTPDGKDRASSKKIKGALGNSDLVGGKGGEIGKATSGSGNDGATQSAESGSEGSSDESDENNNQHEYAAPSNKKGSFDQMLVDGANSQNIANGANGNPIGSVSAANLSMGMDLWSASPANSGVKMRQNPHAAGMMGEQWMDERELKKQKRKQSNRESARRSRLRKQAECEELQVRVDTLMNENRGLKDELQRLSEECEKLTSENSSIKEDLTRLCGPDAVSKLENSNNTNNQLLQSHGDEGNN